MIPQKDPHGKGREEDGRRKKQDAEILNLRVLLE
jgi:hypothetical protein